MRMEHPLSDLLNLPRCRHYGRHPEGGQEAVKPTVLSVGLVVRNL